VLKAKQEIGNMMKELNKALKFKIKTKNQELQDQNLTMRTYNRRKVEIEKWEVAVGNRLLTVAPCFSGRTTV